MGNEYIIKEKENKEFEMKKINGDIYIVDLFKETCSCKAYKYSKGKKTCKHLKEIKGLKTMKEV